LLPALTAKNYFLTRHGSDIYCMAVQQRKRSKNKNTTNYVCSLFFGGGTIDFARGIKPLKIFGGERKMKYVVTCESCGHRELIDDTVTPLPRYSDGKVNRYKLACSKCLAKHPQVYQAF
jgi:predicted nucleic-acid-binding Zn-ribbon protein